MTEYYALSLLAVLGTAILSNITTLYLRDRQWRDWLSRPEDWLGPDGRDFGGDRPEEKNWRNGRVKR